MDIRNAQLEQKEWAAHNFPNNDKTHQLLGLFEEVGELAHAHLKMEQSIRGNRSIHQAAKEDALGDMFVYMMGYANKNDIDLETVFEETWNSVKQRDWVQFPIDGLTK